MVEAFLEFLIIVVFMYILMYLFIGKASGLFWDFVIGGILTILIVAFLLFVMAYLVFGF